MKLAELDPRWLVAPGREGIGVSFLCPHCKEERIYVPFANPLDGGERAAGFKNYWHRGGDTFDSLSLTPSVDCTHFGHFHGFVTNGEVTS